MLAEWGACCYSCAKAPGPTHWPRPCFCAIAHINQRHTATVWRHVSPQHTSTAGTQHGIKEQQQPYMPIDPLFLSFLPLLRLPPSLVALQWLTPPLLQTHLKLLLAAADAVVQLQEAWHRRLGVVLQ